MAGIIGSIILNRHGVRTALLVGTSMAFLGFFITFFSGSSFLLVFFSFSLLAGTGLGIICTVDLTATSLYFDKYRDLAAGGTMTGLAVGMLFFPSCVRLATLEYGWRGAMLILSGVTLNAAVGAAVMRPVRPIATETSVDYDPIEVPCANDNDPQMQTDCGITHDHCRGNDKEHRQQSPQLVDSNAEVCNKIYVDKSSYNGSASNVSLSLNDHADGISRHHNDQHSSRHKQISNKQNCNYKKVELATKTKQPGSKTFDYHIFYSPLFICYLISLMLSNFAMSCFYIFVPAAAMSHGTSLMHAGRLISWSGITSVLARFGVGLIANCSDISVHLLNTAIYAFSGGILIIAPLVMPWYYGQIAVCVFYGLASQGTFTLAPSTCIAIVGLQAITSAMGAHSFSIGLGFLAGGPVGGWLVDVTGLYDATFYLAGGCCIVAAILTFTTYVVEEKRK